MRLLDTHVLLWRERGDRRLGSRTRGEIDLALRESNAAVSAISFWEVAMRVQKNQLDFYLEPHSWRLDLMAQGLAEIPIDGNITVRAGLLYPISTATPATASSSPPPLRATTSSPPTSGYYPGPASSHGSTPGSKPPALAPQPPLYRKRGLPSVSSTRNSDQNL